MARPKLGIHEKKVYRIEFWVDGSDWDKLNQIAKQKRQARAGMARKLFSEALDDMLRIIGSDSS